jgi:malate synthase
MAIGGMAAAVPDRRRPDATRRALERVRADKEREARDGFDGSWVAHPGLVATCREVFDAALGGRPDQRSRRREDVRVAAADLLAVDRTPGRVTEAGLRGNLSVALRYLAAWIDGRGAVALDGLMEDTATAEIARCQVWQWVRHGVALDDGRCVTRDLALAVLDEELDRPSRPYRRESSGTARPRGCGPPVSSSWRPRSARSCPSSSRRPRTPGTSWGGDRAAG